MSTALAQSAPGSLSRTQGLKLMAICFGLAVTVALAVLFPALGHLSIDEAIYNFMTRSFADGGSLTIWNGYDEFPSPELVPPTVHIRDGALVPQYPPMFAILAAPLYRLVGYHALILLNAAAFLGVLGLTFALARRLSGNLDTALDACLILLFATYAFQYGVAAWPHMTSAFFVLAAVACVVRAHEASDARMELLFSLLAGLVAGLGVGVRLDTAFVLPALVLPFLFRAAPRVLAPLAVILGLLPGLLLLAWLNQLKFGIFSPFTYGGAGGGAAGLGAYLPLLGLGLAGTVLLWVATRPRVRGRLTAQWLLAGLIALLVVTALVPVLRDMALRVLDGAGQLIFDMRLRDLDIQEGALYRGPSGGMIYLGSLKKSLLQSLPWLVILVLPIADLVRGRGEKHVEAALLLVPAAFVGVFSFFAWHGGLAFNLRYFVPILPVCAVFGALAWRRIPRIAGRPMVFACAAGALSAIAVVFVATFVWPAGFAEQEAVFLTLPLLIAAMLALLLLLRGCGGRSEAGRGLQCMLVVATVTAFSWSAAVEFMNDLPRAYFVRKARAEFGERVGPMVARDALIFSSFAEIAFRLIDRGDVRFAVPLYDDFESFAALARHHLQQGRPVYIWIGQEIGDQVEAQGLPGGFAVDTLYENDMGRFARLEAGGQ